jgi:hypothetical protein
MSQKDNSSTESSIYNEKYNAPWVERNGFAHWAIAIAWFFLAFFLFQLVGGITSAIVLLPEIMEVMQQGGDIQAVFSDNLSKVFIGNTTGQFLIIGLASYSIAKLHAIPGNHLEFLRLQTSKNVWRVTLITAILVFAFMPLNGFLGWLNYLVFDSLVQAFPSLNWFVEMQDTMAETIKGFISSENAVILAFLHIGIVPAIFEEVMFRGYLLRALEKSWGIIAAILVSGFLFGAYHVQPSNFIPLTMLGILFGYITYVSRSLIPAMIAHLLNNGGQVIYGSMNKEFLDMEMTRTLEIPPLMIVGSTIISAGLIYLLFKLNQKDKQEEESHV